MIRNNINFEFVDNFKHFELNKAFDIVTKYFIFLSVIIIRYITAVRMFAIVTYKEWLINESRKKVVFHVLYINLSFSYNICQLFVYYF